MPSTINPQSSTVNRGAKRWLVVGIVVAVALSSFSGQFNRYYLGIAIDVGINIILAVSLMITMLNQAVVAIASLRGVNLRWGVETLLEQLDPKLKDSARAISEEVLRHPLISDSTLSKFGPWAKHWQLATAIRVDELKHILHEIADAPTPEGKAAPAHSAMPSRSSRARVRRRPSPVIARKSGPGAQGSRANIALISRWLTAVLA